MKHFQRTGTIWTAMAHIITGVIGAGVLSLSWSIAQLGWIGGPITMFAFAVTSLISAFLLCDCYRSTPLPPPAAKLASKQYQHEKYYLVNGSGGELVDLQSGKNNSGGYSSSVEDPDREMIVGEEEEDDDGVDFDEVDESNRNGSFVRAVGRYLGETQEKICSVIVQGSFYGTNIAYTITAAVSIRGILQANCYHREGHEAKCSYEDTSYMVLFGILQIFMSQIPNFHEMEWLSILAAVMSFTYAAIGGGVGIAKVIENGAIKGKIGGVTASSTTNKLYLVFQAVGDIAFAFPFSTIVLDIQDTLKSDRIMKKASTVAISITTFFYLFCGSFGYAAFGDDTPGNLLTGFGFYEPYWLLDFANACVVLHLVGGYQIFSQAVFAYVEGLISERFPESGFVHDEHTIKPLITMGFPALNINLLRLCFRTGYVVSTMVIAMSFPYFNQVLGVLGALFFWPTTIYFPVEMYVAKNAVANCSRQGFLLRGFSLLMFLVSVVALVGSIQGVLSATFS